MSSTTSHNKKTESARFILLRAGRAWSNAFAGVQHVYSTTSTGRETVREAVRRANSESLWIAPRPAGRDSLITAAGEHTALSGHVPRMGTLLAFGDLRQESRMVLGGYFRSVVGGFATFKTLPPGELAEVLSAPVETAGDVFIGASLDHPSRTMVLDRGDFRRLVVPFSLFTPAATATPDFNRFELDDHGLTLRFGDYEAAADFVLYSLDPDFRRRSNARRVQFDKGFGPSLRRLRILRGLGRDAFGLAGKTIARIETGKSKDPHGKTLQAICETLGVEADQIETY